MRNSGNASQVGDTLASGAQDLWDSDAGYRSRLSQEVDQVNRNADEGLKTEIKNLLHSYSDPLAGGFSEKLRKHPDLQSKLAYLTQYTTSKWLLEQELISRGKLTAETAANVYQVARDARSVGVCLSGGGIRSATFNLGILQGLAALRVLGKIDYLSTVSGGGYIHEFLASWIVRENLERIGSKLQPIPAPDDKRLAVSEQVAAPDRRQVVSPEPIRWLRRYSNYLSPSVSLFGADLWTIAAVWARNTLLNVAILVSTLLFLLLLPHFGITDWMLGRHTVPQSFVIRIVIFSLISACGLGAAALLYHSFPRFCVAADEDGGGDQTGVSADEACRRNRTRPWHPYAITALWLCVVVPTSPVVYRLSVPGGSQASHDSMVAYHHKKLRPSATGEIRWITDLKGSRAEWVLCGNAHSECGTESSSRLIPRWEMYKPTCMLPVWLKTYTAACHSFRSVYRTHGLLTPLPSEGAGAASEGAGAASEPTWPYRPPPSITEESSIESPLVWVYESLPLLCMLFAGAIWFRRKELLGNAAAVGGSLCALSAGGFSIFLMEGIRRVFFASTFAVDQNLIASLGIAMLPSLLLAVPFMSLEFCTGLLGGQLGSAQREWVARLRAVSFQVGVVWLVLAGVSLLGPFVYERIASEVALKYTVWLTWAGSTLAGVLLGKSRATSGKQKETEESPTPSTWGVGELVVKIAPLIFIAGLFLLLAKCADGLVLLDAGLTYRSDPLWHWFWMTVAIGCIALLFGWRIDINEFSMNAFYRDRIARCYAGASNPTRDPNLFTGFDVEDGALRVAGLLPKRWKGIDKKAGKYEGPFPIFCTALNLTTGRELAYQERKAASFAFTPLYSGYSTGWTEGTDCSLKYNGFVPTLRHIKTGKGITVASAVAISGAAASPNMGYHSSTAMAFLMTIFNVRLGWWIRNTRVPGRDYPSLGMIQLLKELAASTDDTSKYVYLSDGGHFDNMGLYELLRRRCRTILVCDAEEDAALRFEGIGTAIRKARVDFGIEVTFTAVADPPPAGVKAPVAVTAETGGSPRQASMATPDAASPVGAEGVLDFKHFPGNVFHALKGTIRYPEDGPDELPGCLLYLKSTLTGDEPADVLNYHRSHQSFPFDTTLNQFFTESQFESYRRLGEHIVLQRDIQTWITDRFTNDVDQSLCKTRDD